MSSSRRSRSACDLNQVYHLTHGINDTRDRLAWMIANDQQRSTTISQTRTNRIEHLQSQLSTYTYGRYLTIARAYSPLSHIMDRPEKPKTPNYSVTYIKSYVVYPLSTTIWQPSDMVCVRQRSSRSRSCKKSSPCTRSSSPSRPLEITNILIKDDEAVIEMQPAAAIKSDPTNNDKFDDDIIIYPEGIEDTRPYKIIARYRRMLAISTDTEQNPVNFRLEPLLVGEQHTETLVLGLNNFAEEHGCELIFTNEDHHFDNSIYRATCGVVDVGSIHLLIMNSLPTANFEFDLNLEYSQDIARSKTKMVNFIKKFCKAISTVLNCDLNHIRVFTINRVKKEARKTQVKFGLTTPKKDRTERLAHDLQNDARFGFPDDPILRYVVPKKYEYTWKPALKFLKLKPSDFATEYNFDYRKPGVIEENIPRGYSYHLPIGWYCHALRVLDKYEKDPTWIGGTNHEGEWTIAYHGTATGTTRGIVKRAQSSSFCRTSVMRSKTITQKREYPDRPGIYVTTHCEGGAYPRYTSSFTITTFPKKSERFTLVFQCRIKPKNFTEHEPPVSKGEAWWFTDSTCIRPYAILLKKD